MDVELQQNQQPTIPPLSLSSRRSSLFSLGPAARFQQVNKQFLRTKPTESISLNVKEEAIHKQIDSNWELALGSLLQRHPQKKFKKKTREIQVNDYLLGQPVVHYSLRNTDNKQYCQDFSQYLDGTISLTEFTKRNNFPNTYKNMKSNNSNNHSLSNINQSFSIQQQQEKIPNKFQRMNQKYKLLLKTQTKLQEEPQNQQRSQKNHSCLIKLNMSQSTEDSIHLIKQHKQTTSDKSQFQNLKQESPSISARSPLISPRSPFISPRSTCISPGTPLLYNNHKYDPYMLQIYHNQASEEKQQCFTQRSSSHSPTIFQKDISQSQSTLNFNDNLQDSILTMNNSHDNSSNNMSSFSFKSKGILKLREFFKKRIEKRMQETMSRHSDDIQKTLLFSTLRTINNQTMLQVNKVAKNTQTKKQNQHTSKCSSTPQQIREEIKLQKFYLVKKFNESADEYLSLSAPQSTRSNTQNSNKKENDAQYNIRLNQYLKGPPNSQQQQSQLTKNQQELKLINLFTDEQELLSNPNQDYGIISKNLKNVQLRRKLEVSSAQYSIPKYSSNSKNINKQQTTLNTTKQSEPQLQMRKKQQSSSDPKRDTQASSFLKTGKMNRTSSIKEKDKQQKQQIDRNQDDLQSDDNYLISSSEVKIDELYDKHNQILKYLKQQKDIGFVKKIKTFIKLTDTQKNIFQANMRKLEKNNTNQGVNTHM